MSRQILFVIRGKLGDTITAYATVRTWARAFPRDALTVLVRANYEPLFADEPGIRLIGFGSRIAMFAKLLWMRLTEPAFDALLILLGFGTPIRGLGKMVKAKRKVYLDGRFRDVFPEWPTLSADYVQSEPAWKVARMVEPALGQPAVSRIESLATQRKPEKIIGIAPVSDEPRRSMGPAVLRTLIDALRREHPGHGIHVLINRSDADAQPLLAAGLPESAQFREFPTLETLFAEMGRLEHLYSTDTGLYHLAAAMGVPLTTYYGPTQPKRNGFPAQPALARVRIAALGNDHCEEKGCRRPVCLEIPIAVHHGGLPPAYEVDDRPAGCLLRQYPRARLETITVDAA